MMQTAAIMTIKAPDGTKVCATIGSSTEVYKALGEIARKKRASLTWVVREAAKPYLTGKWTLLRTQKVYRILIPVG